VGILNLLPIREGGQGGDTKIDSNGPMDRRKLLDYFIEAKGNEIPIRGILRHRHGSWKAGESTGPSYAQSSDRVQTEVSVFRIPLECRPRVLGGLVARLLLEGWIMGSLFKEVDEGSLEMPESLLGGDGGDLVQPPMIGSPLKGCKESATFTVSERSALVSVNVGSQPQCPVIDVPTGTENAGEFSPLPIGGIEPKAVSNLHIQMLNETRARIGHAKEWRQALPAA
jgi:hypothetical protein